MMLILYLCLSITLLDQFTKHLVWSSMVLGSPTEVIPGLLSFTYVQTTGAAWGILAGMNVLLVILALVMLVLLVVFRSYFITDALIHRIAMGLMLAGIVGNLIDRIRLGYVVDFVDFYWRSHPYHFPAFNVADSAICIGVGLYIISQFFIKYPETA